MLKATNYLKECVQDVYVGFLRQPRLEVRDFRETKVLLIPKYVYQLLSVIPRV